MADTNNQFKIEGVRLEDLEPVSVLSDETILLVGINKVCRIVSLKSLRKAFAGDPTSPDKDSVYYNATYIDNKFADVETVLTSMRQNITNLTNEVSTSIQNLNTKFDTLSSNLTNKVDTQINEAVESLNTRFDQYTSSTNQNITNLNTTVNNKIKEIEDKIKNSVTDGRFDTLSADLTNKVDTQINEAVESLNTRFDQYTSSTNQNITNLNTTVNNKIKEIENTMKTVVTKSKKVSTNLPASGWVGNDTNPPFSITISVSGVTATNNVEVLLPGTASLEQVEAWCDAGIVHGTQTNGSITLKGYNWKPEIDIPIEVIIRTDI